jgi:hypothetical protein
VKFLNNLGSTVPFGIRQIFAVHNQFTCASFWIFILTGLPAQAVADRVLSETVVGGAETPSIRSGPRAPAGFSEPEPAQPPEPPGQPEATPPVVLVDSSPPLSVWFVSGETVYRSSPTSTDTTSLVFDPVGSSFSLSGRESALGLSMPVAGFRAGLGLSEGRAGGSVRARLENPNLRYINTDLTLSHRSAGFFFEDSVHSDQGGSTARLAVERSRHRLTVSNDYRHGLFYGVPSVERSYKSTDLVLSLGHDYMGHSGFGVFINQSYRLPIDDGFGVTGSAVSVGLKKELGPPPTWIQDYQNQTIGCRGFEVFGSGGVSSLSGKSSETNLERSAEYVVKSALGWDASALGGRYRFGAGGGCGVLWGALSRKTLNYGTGYIEQLQPVVYTDPFESTGTLTLDGIEVGLGRQLDLNAGPAVRGYVFGAVSTFFGSGTTTAVSRFGSRLETTSEPADAILVGLRLGSGYERSIGPRRYLFYEMSVSRYDARPFGSDLRGIEVGLDLGLGFY